MSEPLPACDGCTACAQRCIAGIQISEFEYTRIVEYLRAHDPQLVRRTLEEPKERPWAAGVMVTACLFHDLRAARCLIAPVRPLVCRLFGHVPHLPCPRGVIAPDRDATHILDAYTQQPLQTFQAWMIADGCFNFDDLLGPTTPERIEL